MLTNDELLEEEREKAENIKRKMGNVSGSGYGSMGSGKYENYSSKNYGKTDKHAQNTNSEFHYGNYNTGKSTLDKYKPKEDQKSKNTSMKTNTYKNTNSVWETE